MKNIERTYQLVEEWSGLARETWEFPVVDLHLRIVELVEQVINQCFEIADNAERQAVLSLYRATDSADRMKISGRAEAAAQIAVAIRDIV